MALELYVVIAIHLILSLRLRQPCDGCIVPKIHSSSSTRYEIKPILLKKDQNL